MCWPFAEIWLEEPPPPPRNSRTRTTTIQRKVLMPRTQAVSLALSFFAPLVALEPHFTRKRVKCISPRTSQFDNNYVNNFLFRLDPHITIIAFATARQSWLATTTTTSIGRPTASSTLLVPRQHQASTATMVTTRTHTSFQSRSRPLQLHRAAEQTQSPLNHPS